jgi:hypothetical protein
MIMLKRGWGEERERGEEATKVPRKISTIAPCTKNAYKGHIKSN